MEQNLDLEAGALESRKAEISELAQAELNRETRRTSCEGSILGGETRELEQVLRWFCFIGWWSEKLP